MKTISRFSGLAGLVALALFASVAVGKPLTRRQAIERMKPYAGKHIRGVDTSTMHRKVMCGYQGWFAAEGDGSGKGWFHYSARGRFEPGQVCLEGIAQIAEAEAHALNVVL